MGFCLYCHFENDKSGCGSVLVHKHANSILQGSDCYLPFGPAVLWSYSASPRVQDFLKYAHFCMHEARAALGILFVRLS